MLAEWLDNDRDGCVDTPAVLAKLLETEDIGQQYGVQWPARPAFIFPSTTQARASNEGF